MRPRQEPLTINADVVTETLLRHGYPNMADFVQMLSRQCRDHYQREELLRSAHNRTIERLHKYEPPTRYEPVSYQPPPEASD